MDRVAGMKEASSLCRQRRGGGDAAGGVTCISCGCGGMCRQGWSLLALGMLCCLAALAKGHPQCLDFGAPFEATEKENSCSQHADSGCCTAADSGETGEEGWMEGSWKTIVNRERNMRRCEGWVTRLG